jgi:hypothetical protein
MNTPTLSEDNLLRLPSYSSSAIIYLLCEARQLLRNYNRVALATHEFQS